MKNSLQPALVSFKIMSKAKEHIGNIVTYHKTRKSIRRKVYFCCLHFPLRRGGGGAGGAGGAEAEAGLLQSNFNYFRYKKNIKNIVTYHKI